MHCLGSENTIENRIVTILPLSDLNNLQYYDQKIKKVLWEHIGGESNMVQLDKVIGKIISRSEYLHSKSPTYKRVPFHDHIHKSNKVSLDIQLMQLSR